MKIFVTGASGHIGSFVVPDLLNAGHTVIGLARSDASSDRVKALGGEPRRGDLADPAGLAAVVADVDGVVHLAFNHDVMRGGDFAAAARQDLATVAALGDALAGSGKAFVGIGLAPTGDPEIDAKAGQNPRAAVSRLAAGFPERGIRSSLVAVPPVTHSHRDVAGFVPTLIGIARRTGVSGYLSGAGSVHWAAAHTSDIAQLFRLAIEKAPAGSQLYGSAEERVPVQDIAEAIARHLGLEAQSVTLEEAPEHFGPFAQILALEFPPMPSGPTRELLGWEPVGVGLLDEIDAGHYFKTD